MNPPVILPLTRYRITAVMHDELRLPDYAGSLLRGVFGATLRKAACMTGMPACPACPLWRTCPYPALFETPPQPTQLRQQFSQVPNPYVIEPPPLGTRSIGAGEALVFHMVLIGAQAQRQLPLVQYAWQRALKQGLGKERIPGELVAMEATEPFASEGNVDDVDQPEQLTLQIQTPLRLQHNGHALGPDELSPRVLLSQLLRRTSLMLELHMGIHPAPFDAPALLSLSESLQDDRSQLHWKDWTRYSTRQRQEMTLGGVLGAWTLHGQLAPFLPWLHLGQWLHLGKNATMGMGGYRLMPA
ncbi:MAG: CRISPR system precrRNA processing endoribonuclease RAMP protein Cas6 [Leptothrix ochracea]|uniref:CRISPR system precrRNA processing endoribonuclease RAMP protein Cas6 n=2 Tax=Leptothrix ochracea TaxID=735331 RepID=UPI0034E1B429